MTDSSGHDNRVFSRVAMARAATLKGPGGPLSVTVEDISLNGVLVRLPDATGLPRNDPYELSLPLGDEATITMALSVAHQEGARAGFRCRHIDLDSVSHLRRVVEYNLGDPDLVHRELGELSRGR